jgi:glycosyltransferase involved in cell wall biosynthesis
MHDGLELHIHRPLSYARGLRCNPLSVAFLRSLRDADVIHCHQLGTVVTDVAILYGKIRRIPVFGTDLGGSADLSLMYHFPIWKWLRALILISDYNRGRNRRLPVSSHVVLGGVDPLRFTPGPGPCSPRLLHVGRVLPDKGIHHLLDALPEGVPLDIVGSLCDPAYTRHLREKSEGKPVYFHGNLSDMELARKYQAATVTVLPALVDSGYTTALESFACATPVIASSVGSIPEILREGATGFLVLPQDVAGLRGRIQALVREPARAAEMGRQARQETAGRFSWNAVAQRCLQIYQDKPS